MIGLTLVFISALFLALSDCGKKVMTRSYPTALINFFPVTIGWLVQGGYLLATGGPPLFDILNVLPLLCVIVVVTVTMESLFVKGIAQGDLSLSLPLTAFVPVFAGVGSWLFLGELPALISLLGVLLVVAGTWVILRTPGSGPFDPFLVLFRSPGPRLIFIMAALNGIFYPLLKVGGDISSPAWFFTFMLMGESLVFGALLIQERINPVRAFLARPGLTLSTSLAWFIGLSALNGAIGYMLIAQASALQRVHLLWIVLFGHLFFGEPGFRQRMSGALIMLAGVAWLVLV